MNTLSDMDRGWIAGLFEGEGCVRTLCRPQPTHRGQVRFQMMQVDRSTLDRLVEATGVGRITGPYEDCRPRTRTQPYYVWTCTKQDDVDAFAVAIFPLLSERRQQQVLAAFETWKDSIPA